jgi:hypothetical protein
VGFNQGTAVFTKQLNGQACSQSVECGLNSCRPVA